MNAKQLREKVIVKYHELNIKDGRYTAQDLAYKAPEQQLKEMPSNQINALIEVIAPLLSLDGGLGIMPTSFDKD